MVAEYAVPGVSVRDAERMAYALAWKYRRLAVMVGLEPGDLAQEAMLGMAKAARKYDPGRGEAVRLLWIAAQRRVWKVLRRQRPLAQVPKRAGQEDALAQLPARPEADPWVRSDVGALLDRLPESARGLVESYFGIGGGPPRTLEDLAMERGITRQRVHQKLARALDTMREAAGVN
jgi:RNA polymerase sigma factor (sigma-70 family)